ncbi:hypothetical protein DMUE_1597 [Dictyocoela muelleri]|nr:hypothetical protein DMUE_1597 [Dictyocoela muelleri]
MIKKNHIIFIKLPLMKNETIRNLVEIVNNMIGRYCFCTYNETEKKVYCENDGCLTTLYGSYIGIYVTLSIVIMILLILLINIMTKTYPNARRRTMSNNQ